PGDSGQSRRDFGQQVVYLGGGKSCGRRQETGFLRRAQDRLSTAPSLRSGFGRNDSTLKGIEIYGDCIGTELTGSATAGSGNQEPRPAGAPGRKNSGRHLWSGQGCAPDQRGSAACAAH